jgi:glutaredoxin 3
VPSSDVRIYTTDACGYCVRAKGLLESKGVSYEEIHFPRSDVEARMRLVELTGRYTVPQILIGDRPIGGWEDLRALERAGELDRLLAAGAGPTAEG